MEQIDEKLIVESKQLTSEIADLCHDKDKNLVLNSLIQVISYMIAEEPNKIKRADIIGNMFSGILCVVDQFVISIKELKNDK